MQKKTIETKPLYRSSVITREAIDEEARTVEIAFSSEEPVERWFGKEILDHSPGSVRLSRLNDGGAGLVDHNSRDHVAVVEQAKIDSGDRMGRALLRFGQSARAAEIFQDVVDRIRSKISVGYRLHRLILEEETDEGDTYRATDWEPFEVSIVAVPADATVGVGRSADETMNTCTLEVREMSTDLNKPTNAQPAPAQPAPAIDTDKLQRDAAKAERERVQRLLALGAEHNHPKLAQRFVDQGRSVEDFDAITADINAQAPLTRDQDPAITPVQVDLDGKEAARFSVVKAIRSALSGDWRAAGLEQRVSQEVARQLGREPQDNGFFIPSNLNVRQLVAGTTTAGGHTVAQEMQSMIDLLRNRMMVKRLGARVLSGLQGDLAFPRQDGTTTLYWVGEDPGSDVTESQASFDQIVMSPKTAQATTAYSRQLLAQASIDVENFVRDDLVTINALGLDSAAINGTGADNQPTGIRNTTGVGLVAIDTNGGAPTWPHMVQMETEIAQDNADVDAMAYLTNAKVRGVLKTTEKASDTAQFIWSEVGSQVNGYRAEVSNQVPSDLTKGTGEDLSGAVFGNWNDLMIGEWGVVEIIVDPYALKKQGLVEVTSIMLVDIAVRHPESFSIIEDIITA